MWPWYRLFHFQVCVNFWLRLYIFLHIVEAEDTLMILLQFSGCDSWLWCLCLKGSFVGFYGTRNKLHYQELSVSCVLLHKLSEWITDEEDWDCVILRSIKSMKNLEQSPQLTKTLRLTMDFCLPSLHLRKNVSLSRLSAEDIHSQSAASSQITHYRQKK